VADVESERRIRSVPTTGARLSLLMAALMAALCVYFFLAPISVSAANGRAFDCGNAVNGPRTDFARGVCGNAGSQAVAKATVSGAMAVLLAVGGFLVFGVERREELAPRGRQRPDDGEGHS
jgi:hypothetical protein